MRRERAKRQPKVARRPLRTEDIPPGSMLSEQTLADIQAGHYVLERDLLSNSRPSRKERARQGRIDRLRARQRSR